MSITVTSTTDTLENVQSAMGGKAPDPKPVEDKSAPEAKSTEQNKTEDSEATETETKEAEPAESETPKESKEFEGDEEEADKGKSKKKGGFQRRIDKLNARVSERERELEYWKQQALKGPPSGAQNDSKPAPQPKSKEGKPNPDDFDNYTAYSESLADWKAEQKIQEYEQRQNKARLDADHANAQKSLQDRIKTFAEKNPDYHEVLDDVDDVPLAPTLSEILMTSEDGPAMIYELAKNREELERINKLSPLALAKEMGKIEFRLKSAAKDSVAETKNKTTQAPKPINPIGSKGKQSEKSIYDANLSQKEYEALRAKQRSAG